MARRRCCWWLGAMIAIMIMTGIGVTALGREEGTGGTCVPVSERAGRNLGCYITAQSVGYLGREPMFWHLDTYSSRTAAEAAKGVHGTVVESLGQVWLFTIADEGWLPVGGERGQNRPLADPGRRCICGDVHGGIATVAGPGSRPGGGQD